MKVRKIFTCLLITASFLMITACGGGGGGDSTGTGEVSISITDAKPLLPEGVTNLWITFTEVLVHKSGGGWISLPLIGDLPSNTIDLLQFLDGYTTELVQPVLLEYGKYTQIRLVIAEVDGARIKFKDDPKEYPVEIPPENLKTDKNFTFDPQDPAAADIVIDFDLSQSLVVTGPPETPSYKLKPVLHIVYGSEADTITGAITDQSFTNFDNNEANIAVMADGEVYTEITVERDEPNDVEFTIFWLDPEKNYIIEIDMDPANNNGADWQQSVPKEGFVDGEKNLGSIFIEKPSSP